MATLSFGVTGPTQDWTVRMEIADTDSPRILAFLMSSGSGFGTVTENLVQDVPDASWSPGEGQTEADRPTTQVQSWVSRPASPEEAAQNYARSILASLLSSTVSWERQVAAAEAVAKISEIQPA